LTHFRPGIGSASLDGALLARLRRISYDTRGIEALWESRLPLGPRVGGAPADIHHPTKGGPIPHAQNLQKSHPIAARTLTRSRATARFARSVNSLLSESQELM